MMLGLEQFLSTFGDITVLQVVELILAIVFLVVVYKKFKTYLIEKNEQEKARDEKIEEALSATKKYPEYRKQSLDIQKLLQSEIDEIKRSQEENMKKLIEMETATRKRECSKLRGRLLEYYRYYTNVDKNPLKAWTAMEADAFWAIFTEYEESGGNGYIHSNVQPVMNTLLVVEMDDIEGIRRLMESRK